jgi:hypothetical protein
MNAFEQLVGMLLERKGYWVRSDFKVDLSKEEKRKIGRPSSPRWELDIVAYKPSKNEVLVVECKSYLDSRGVTSSSFDGTNEKLARRYKLFIDGGLRETVLKRLVLQLEEAGLCRPAPTVILCLVAGRIATEQDRAELAGKFNRAGWELWDDKWIRDTLMEIASSSYEDDVSSVVAKILLRKSKGPRSKTPVKGHGLQPRLTTDN